MPFEVIMPKLSLTMQEGIITRWIKTEGENVEKDEPLFEVQTEKVNYEIKSPASGILIKILCPEDISTPVGEVIALIGEQGEEGIEIPAGPVVPPVRPVGHSGTSIRRAGEHHAGDRPNHRGSCRQFAAYPAQSGPERTDHAELPAHFAQMSALLYPANASAQRCRDHRRT